MILRPTAGQLGIFIASLLVVTVCGPSAVHAAVLFGLWQDLPTTAGVPTSTRSGPGSWQLYAIEDAASSDLGLASYNITMTGTTAINNRSPNGTAIDSNGDTQNWGFSLLRSGTNVNPIVASQPLPGLTPFFITGLGRTAGNASSQILAADPGASGISATSGATWGNYLTGAFSPFFTNMQFTTGHKWVFLAEGLGRPTVLSAAATVLSNANGAQIAAASLIVNPQDDPEPASFALAAIACAVISGVRRRQPA